MLAVGSQKSTRMPMAGVAGGGAMLLKVIVMLKTVAGSTITVAPAKRKAIRNESEVRMRRLKCASVSIGVKEGSRSQGTVT